MGFAPLNPSYDCCIWSFRDARRAGPEPMNTGLWKMGSGLAALRRRGMPFFSKRESVVYVRMKPSISDSAQSIAALIDLPDCVHWWIIFMIVACANIWVPIFSGAG
jgi:hypothetical protein